MSDTYIKEIEARLENYKERIKALEKLATMLNQQLPRAWQQGSGAPSGGDGKIYFAISDGVAQATGTWPSITPDTFTSDVYDGSSGSLVLVTSSATIYWFDVDALAAAGAIAKCTRNDDDTYIGILETCTDAT